MTNKEAIRVLQAIKEHPSMGVYLPDEYEALNIAIGAVERDKKVDDITFHWNDNKSNFVAACIAFEEILKVYGRGVDNDKVD